VSYTKADIEKMAKQIRYDMSVTKTRIDELMTAVASLPVVEATGEFTCGDCHGLKFSSTKRLAEHRENVHGEFAEVA
jgi:hypothetical protein